jgi:hypothetical protein
MMGLSGSAAVGLTLDAGAAGLLAARDVGALGFLVADALN